MAYPKLSTIAIINQIEKVLLVRRAAEPERDKWALPGGNLGFKSFSDPAAAVKEEMNRLLGVNLTVDYFLNYYYGELSGAPAVEFVFCGKIGGQPKPDPGQVKAWRFFSEEEIAGLDLASNHKKILIDFLYQ